MHKCLLLNSNNTYEIKDLDHEKLVEIIKQCWARACLREDEYSEMLDEIDRLSEK